MKDSTIKPDSKSKQEIREILTESKINPKSQKSKRAKNAKYFARKKKIFELEKTNGNHLYFYPASDIETNNIKFYHLGGNSAIIYSEEYASRIERKARVRRDTDLGECRFFRGICTFSDVETVVEKLLALGTLKREPDDDGIIILKLPREYTKSEITAMFKARNTEFEKLNNLLSPNITHPELNKQIIKLRKELPAKINKFPDRYFETIGKKLFDALDDLCYNYTLLLRDQMDKQKACGRMLVAVERIFTCLTLINDCELWEVSACARIAETATTLERLLKSGLPKLK